jgi:probable F420-dependent oxidoreductase, Rv2161c family
MKYGLNVLNFGPTMSADTIRRWVVGAERLGYHAALISDHVALTPSVKAQYPPPFFDAFTTLAWLSGLTTRIQLGTTVAVLPYRNAHHQARVVANIDQFSDGRFIFGVGAGYYQDEFEALGIDYNRRGEISNQFLDLIIKSWAGPAVEDPHSTHVVATGPAPVQRPTPPIWVGGNSHAAMRRALTFGTAWHPFLPDLDWLATTGIPALQQLASAAGRDCPAIVPRVRLMITEARLGVDRNAGEGACTQIKDDIRRLEDLGCEYVVFDTYSGAVSERRPEELDWKDIERLATEILDLG